MRAAHRHEHHGNDGYHYEPTAPPHLRPARQYDKYSDLNCNTTTGTTDTTVTTTVTAPSASSITETTTGTSSTGAPTGTTTISDRVVIVPCGQDLDAIVNANDPAIGTRFQLEGGCIYTVDTMVELNEGDEIAGPVRLTS